VDNVTNGELGVSRVVPDGSGNPHLRGGIADGMTLPSLARLLDPTPP
jgi:hypothetical protein